MEQIAGLALEDLDGFKGRLIQPTDPVYDEARATFNGMIDKHPALIAQCAGVEDVRAALAFGRGNGLTIAIRGGGHSTPGYSTCDGGLVIDLRPMKEITIDPEARTARVQGGATWGDLDAATQEHGLAVTGGRVSDTGVAGLTLGSGSGWLSRFMGLSCDNLIGAEVVTPDGSVIKASEDENAELLWGLRGGGGNFGVVTDFEFNLAEVGHTILAGQLIHPRERAEEVMAFYRDFISETPDEVSGGVALISAPPAPFIPEEMRLKPITAVIVAYFGPPEEGEEALKPLREFGPPLIDMVQPMPYAALQKMIDEGAPQGIHEYFRIDYIEELSDDAIRTLVGAAGKTPSPMSQIILEPLGGAQARFDEDHTALRRPQTPFAYHCLSLWPGEMPDEPNVAWAKEFSDAMRPFCTQQALPNFIAEDEGDSRLRLAFGEENYARLVALKDKYDPDNLLSLNQNIKPNGG
jgi:hypothetical protein